MPSESRPANHPALSGLLNLNKPTGVTSRWVVNQVQRLVRPAKTGHAGTLDPLASGVLVVCVGAATRLIDYVQRMPKRYTGTFLLGRSSPTEDVEGEVTLLPNAPQPTLEQLGAAASRFIGQIEQRPPAYSALKVAGRRAYDLARAGQEVELAPRMIEIYCLTIQRYEYPELVLNIECGSGTYVRSLGRDLAHAVGTESVMSALVRTAIGAFSLDQAADPRDLTPESLLRLLLPPTAALEALPKLRLTPEEARRISHGLAIHRTPPEPAAEFAGLDEAGRLLAILEPRDAGLLHPTRTFPPAPGP